MAAVLGLSLLQSQGINELQVEDGITEFFDAQKSDHTVLSVEHAFDSGLRLRAEAYRKKMRVLRPRFENLFDSLVLLPELQPDRVRVDPDTATAKGIEILVSDSTAARFPWWASYTRSSVKDRIAGASTRRFWDERHAFKAGVSTVIGPWELNAAWTYHTGWPTTELTLATVTNPDGSTSTVAVPGDRNAANFGPFSSLDFRAARSFSVKFGKLMFFGEVTNLYNRENPCCTEYATVTSASGVETLDANPRNWLQIVPSVGVIWEF